jgi:hypothetical protein
MSSWSHGSLSHPNTKLLQCDDGGRRDRRGYAFYACRRVTTEFVIRKEKWQTKPCATHCSTGSTCSFRFILLHLYVRPDDMGLVTERRVRFPFTQQHLADAIGLSLVHTNKTLKTPRAHPMGARLVLSAGSRGPGGGRQVRCAAQASSAVTLVRAVWSFHSAGFIVLCAYGDRSWP